MSLAISRARATDPLTSYNAAVRAEKFAGSQADRIHTFLLSTVHAAADTIAASTGLTVEQCCRRLPELQRQGRARVVQANGEDFVVRGYRVWAGM